MASEHLSRGSRRRLFASSTTSYTTHLTESFEEDLISSLKLLSFLESPGHISSSAPNDNELGRMLSQRTVVSTTCSFSQRQSSTATSSEVLLEKIGAGSCGTILSRDGHSVIFKLQKSLFAGKVGDLENDFNLHKITLAALSAFPEIAEEIKIPQLHRWTPATDRSFWKQNGDSFSRAAQKLDIPCNVIEAERILPMPLPIREALIEKFCPEHLQDIARNDQSNKDCLVRVYLGRKVQQRSQPRRFFSLRNFPLHVDQAIECGLDIHVLTIAMAGTLAALHWLAKIDAKDVEFVLGSSPIPLPEMPTEVSESCSQLNFHKREIRLWLLDFNLCSEIEMNESGLAMAVHAWTLNDPYYPRPLQEDPICKELWNLFASRYIEASDIILQSTPDLRPLPRRFLVKVIDAQRQKIMRGYLVH